MIQLAAGLRHHCALIQGGVQCWGYGEGIDGSSNYISSPTWITGYEQKSGVDSICAGYVHTCLIKAGKVYCWGNNDYKQARQASSTVTVPTLVSGIPADVIQISCGFYHSCAVLVDGRAMCWGSDAYGELGRGSVLSASTPVPAQVFTFNDVVEIVAGSFSTCAIRLVNSQRQTWCWGSNYFGQLGNGGTATSQTSAIRMTQDFLGGPKTLSRGYLAYCGTSTQDDAAYCVGYGNGGQLGNGDQLSKSSLTAVTSLGSGVSNEHVDFLESSMCCNGRRGSVLLGKLCSGPDSWFWLLLPWRWIFIEPNERSGSCGPEWCKRL